MGNANLARSSFAAQETTAMIEGWRTISKGAVPCEGMCWERSRIEKNDCVSKPVIARTVESLFVGPALRHLMWSA